MKSLNETESVSKTLEELLSFTTRTSESADSCSMDAGEEIYRFKCNQCEYKAKYRKYLKQIHGHACNQCDHQFIEKRNLFKKHVSSIHKAINHCCDQCGFLTTSPRSLKMHKGARHKGIIYSCDTCQYSRKTYSKLKRHQRTQSYYLFL